MKKELIVLALAAPEEDGTVLCITPEQAGWKYVGFKVVKLAPGQRYSGQIRELEICLVLLSGTGSISIGGQPKRYIGNRMNVFEKTPPYAAYISENDEFEFTAETHVELAECSAPGGQGPSSRIIAPEDITPEVRGSGSMERLVHNILPETSEASSLLVVEVFTPEGHWSSYPPHKHDREALPCESLLEETYYYRIHPEQGFAVQRVYTDDRELDETLTVQNGQAVLVPKGYHPVSAPAGYEVYYLNVMAGPERTWRYANDPAHAWLLR